MEIFETKLFSNQWLVFFVVSVLFLLASEIGFRFGLKLHQADDVPRKKLAEGIQSAMLALLGLLLAFTFAMAANRYEFRRELVIKESNAIGTTYLRAAFLSETHQHAVEDLLRRYIDVRLSFYGAAADPSRLIEAEQRAAQLQSQLWTVAVAAVKENPTPPVTAFVTSLNDTIDLDATRLYALRSHVPGPVWLLLLTVGIMGCCASGYCAGANGVRGVFSNILLPLLIAVVITFIADLDRPRHGLIGISQRPLIDLQQSFQSTK